MKVDRAVAMRKTEVLFGGIVLIMLALIVANAMSFEYSRPLAALDADTANVTISLTEAASAAAPSTTIPSPSPFDEWARGRKP
jgi:hypothetical protein